MESCVIANWEVWALMMMMGSEKEAFRISFTRYSKGIITFTGSTPAGYFACWWFGAENATAKRAANVT